MKRVPFEPLDPGAYREIVRRALAEDFGWGASPLPPELSGSGTVSGTMASDGTCQFASSRTYWLWAWDFDDAGNPIYGEYTGGFSGTVTPSLDAAGNLYVSDRMHHRYAKFGTDGLLKDFEICGDRGTVGIGFNWPADLAVDDETGNIWLADTHQNRLQVLNAACTTTA